MRYLYRNVKRSLLVSGITICLLLLYSTQALAQGTGPIKPEDIKSFQFRELGPAVTGGRVHDVEAVPGDPFTIYVGAASGGVWKTVNGGTTWTPLWNDLPNSSVGDIAIAPSDHNVVYVGTGGPNNRQSTLYGNGVWKSTDGGQTWEHCGLVETRHIGRIHVHPENPDIVYVAALGNLWKANTERGVFKSVDGGRNWSRVLYVDENTGAVDMVIDPSDPDVLYVATYQRQRRTWGFIGGGPGSGIHKTEDGGRTWTLLSNGLPEGDKGRIGLAISRSNPQVLNATVEHRGGQGTYRTGNGGESWEFVNRMNPRPMYYSHIIIDPSDENRVYVLGSSSSVSEDGGRNFRGIPSAPTYDVGVHGDHHSLWIDPDNPDYLLLGGDAGLYISYDRGIKWRKINNFAIGQFYAIGVDMRDPYWVYGGLQDNHSWMGPTQTRRFIGIINDDWRQTGFSDGMYAQPDPQNYRRVYIDSQGGNIIRFDPETGASESIRPSPPEGEERYRFDWTAPILISPHDHNRIYLGGNRLFISDNGGSSWYRTEDLSRRIDRDTLEIMGVLPGPQTISRHDGTSSFGEITTIAESPVEEGLLWVGTDDGNVQLSRNTGESWQNVVGNVPGLPDQIYVSRVIASHFDAGRAYATFDAHRDGDFRPFVYVTEDYGNNWRAITNGLPDEGSVNVIREHHLNPDLLFVGTEHSLFVSLDAGSNWMQFKNNLPTAPIDDLVIHPRDNDLLIGTHGRSIWVMDDITFLSGMNPNLKQKKLHVMDVQPAAIHQKWKATSYRGQGEFAAHQPPDGAVINYWVGRGVEEPVSIEIITAEGRTVRSLQGSAEAGLQRVVWDLRLDPMSSIRRGGQGRSGGAGGGAARGMRSNPNMTPWLQQQLADRGPHVVAGIYTVRLSTGDESVAGTIEVRPDPADPGSEADQKRRWMFLLSVYDLNKESTTRGAELQAIRSRANTAGNALRNTASPPSGLTESISELITLLDSTSREMTNIVSSGIRNIIGVFTGSAVRQGTIAGPTDDQFERLTSLRNRFEEASGVLQRLIETEIPRLDRQLERAGIPPIGG